MRGQILSLLVAMMFMFVGFQSNANSVDEMLAGSEADSMQNVLAYMHGQIDRKAAELGSQLVSNDCQSADFSGCEASLIAEGVEPTSAVTYTVPNSDGATITASLIEVSDAVMMIDLSFYTKGRQPTICGLSVSIDGSQPTVAGVQGKLAALTQSVADCVQTNYAVDFKMPSRMPAANSMSGIEITLAAVKAVAGIAVSALIARTFWALIVGVHGQFVNTKGKGPWYNSKAMPLKAVNRIGTFLVTKIPGRYAYPATIGLVIWASINVFNPFF